MNRDTNRLVRELLSDACAGDPRVSAVDAEWFDRKAAVFDRLAKDHAAQGSPCDAAQCAEFAVTARIRAAELRAGRQR